MRQHIMLLLNEFSKTNVIHQLNGILSFRHKKFMTPSAGFRNHNCEQYSTVETASISTEPVVKFVPSTVGKLMVGPS